MSNRPVVVNRDIPGVLMGRLMYFQILMEFSESECGDIILHDGPETAEDRMIRERHRIVWENNYLPEYRRRCKESGVPENPC